MKVKYNDDDEIITFDKIKLITNFDNLTFFDCSFSYLGYLPALPTNLKHLRCFKNYLTELNNLPNLITLYCGHNNIRKLENLPLTLKELGCSNNDMIKINVDLLSLDEFYCYNNKIKNIKINSRVIWINDNKLLNFKTFDSTETLNISNNKISEINELPQNLLDLNCSYNPKLSFINLFPNCLVSLRCSFCNLEFLPPLPKTLKNCYVNNNKLTELPSFEKTQLIKLHCQDNYLTEIKILSQGIKIINCSNNKIILYDIPKSIEEIICLNNPIIYNL